jgi:hypothetical protein
VSQTTASALLRFAQQLQIAHHIPGRIRLRLSGPVSNELIAMADDAKRFGKALSGMNGIRSISLKLISRSCVVEYDAHAIPPSAWRGLVSGETTPESETLRRQLLSAIPA